MYLRTELAPLSYIFHNMPPLLIFLNAILYKIHEVVHKNMAYGPPPILLKRTPPSILLSRTLPPILFKRTPPSILLNRTPPSVLVNRIPPPIIFKRIPPLIFFKCTNPAFQVHHQSGTRFKSHKEMHAFCTCHSRCTAKKSSTCNAPTSATLVMVAQM